MTYCGDVLAGQDLVDTHIYADARGVLEALGRHDCEPALAWCEANRARLRKYKSKLEFKLRVQARLFSRPPWQFWFQRLLRSLVLGRPELACLRACAGLMCPYRAGPCGACARGAAHSMRAGTRRRERAHPCRNCSARRRALLGIAELRG